MDGTTGVAELVQGARANRQGDWDGLVERYTPLVLSVVRGFRLQDPDTQDVVQTLWLRLVEHVDDIREPAALPGWIVTTARNECLRTLRQRQRALPVDPVAATLAGEDARTTGTEPAVPPDVSVVEHLTQTARHRVLLEAVAELPAHHRALLGLLLADPPLTYADISHRLGIPIGGIGPTRARALQRIREHPAVAAWMAADAPVAVGTAPAEATAAPERTTTARPARTGERALRRATGTASPTR